MAGPFKSYLKKSTRDGVVGHELAHYAKYHSLWQVSKGIYINPYQASNRSISWFLKTVVSIAIVGASFIRYPQASLPATALLVAYFSFIDQRVCIASI